MRSKNNLHHIKVDMNEVLDKVWKSQHPNHWNQLRKGPKMNRNGPANLFKSTVWNSIEMKRTELWNHKKYWLEIGGRGWYLPHHSHTSSAHEWSLYLYVRYLTQILFRVMFLGKNLKVTQILINSNNLLFHYYKTKSESHNANGKLK